MESVHAKRKVKHLAPFRAIAATWISGLLGLLAACGEPPSETPEIREGPSTLEALEAELPANWQGRLDLTRGLSPDARLDTFLMLALDAEAPRSPSDGGGRAWIEAAQTDYPASGRPSLEIVYEAGPLGIAEGGVIFLQPSPFWGWDPPQVHSSTGPGYTEVVETPDGISFHLDDYSKSYLAMQVEGRAMAPGEQVRIVYGAGPSGAQVDTYAEADSPIYISVDGDGDGIRKVIESPPSIDVVGTPTARLHLVLPSTARPGETVRLQISALDSKGSTSPLQDGGVVFIEPPAGLPVPAAVDLGGEHSGRRTLDIKIEEPGLYRLEVQGTGDIGHLHARSGPLLVREEAPRVRWGDLHGHSQLSDGTATPDQYFEYARDVAGLDVSALTDHDHWGVVSLDTHPSMWQEIGDSVDAHHEPGRFVTLHGYEWTSWLHGHRHVLYFNDQGEIYSSIDPDYQTPTQLWDALRGQDALTFAHHSAGGPVSTNWLYPPDPVLEPVTEIVSVHGSSEAPDSPAPIYDPVSGNYVRNALDAGYVLGFVGSGDSHDGHPGLPQLAAGRGLGGLAAIYSEELTRDGVLDALRARRTYATNGSRILLSVSIDGHPMGSMLSPPESEAAAEQRLEIEVHGTAPIERIDLIRSGQTATLAGEGRTSLNLERSIPSLKAGEYHYVRVVQEDEGAAWSSPIFVRGPVPAAAAADSVRDTEAEGDAKYLP